MATKTDWRERCAYLERDCREYHKLINILKAAGIVADESLDNAWPLIWASRESDPFTQIDKIKEDLTG